MAESPLNAIDGGLEPGVYDDVSDADYFALPYLSQSQINAAFDDYGRFRSLAHGQAALAKFDDPDRDVTAFRFGTAFHVAVLEPDVFESSRVEIDKAPGKTKAGKMLVTNKDFAWADGEHPGAVIVRPEWVETIERMRDAVMSHKYGSRLVTAMRSTARKELVLVWDEETPIGSVRCRAKIDRHLPGIGLADLKSCSDPVSAESWGRTVLKRGYHRQDSFYSRGSLVTGLEDELRPFFFVAVEKSEPYGVSVCTIDRERDNQINPGVSSFDAGWNDCREYLFRWAEALSTGRVHGYDEAVEDVCIPAHALKRHFAPAISVDNTGKARHVH